MCSVCTNKRTEFNLEGYLIYDFLFKVMAVKWSHHYSIYFAFGLQTNRITCLPSCYPYLVQEGGAAIDRQFYSRDISYFKKFTRIQIINIEPIGMVYIKQILSNFLLQYTRACVSEDIIQKFNWNSTCALSLHIQIVLLCFINVLTAPGVLIYVAKLIFQVLLHSIVDVNQNIH